MKEGFDTGGRRRDIRLVVDNDVLARYEQYYFSIHPKAQKKPIAQPYHESINLWMIMKRPMMNALKQKWKDFIRWFADDQGYSNLHIEQCEISQKVFYSSNRRHDIDNSVPKFILDGLVESGMLADDDSKHVTKLVLECAVDAQRPRTELVVHILDKEKEEVNRYGEKKECFHQQDGRDCKRDRRARADG